MKTMSNSLEDRIEIAQCHGTVVKLPKLSSSVGTEQRMCLKCSAFNPDIGVRDDGDTVYCLQGYGDGPGSPIESLPRRFWNALKQKIQF